MKGYSMQEKHRANWKLQEEKKKTKKIHNRKPNNRLITKEKES